mgnify:CR=1 FL=1
MRADFFSDPVDKETILRQHTIIEMRNDFIVWLFEESGELDHISLAEAEKLHEKYLESL